MNPVERLKKACDEVYPGNDPFSRAIASSNPTALEPGDEIDEVIRHEGGHWVVRSKKGKLLGKHPTKAAAQKQLAAVEISKHGG